MKIKYYINLAKKMNNFKTDTELAKKLGIKPASLYNISNNKTKQPKPYILGSILDLAKISDEEKEFVFIEYMSQGIKKGSDFYRYLNGMKENNSFYRANYLNK